jgi:S-adenosylmethionine decarboxylase
LRKSEIRKKKNRPGSHILINVYFSEFPAVFESVSFGRKFFAEAIGKGNFRILKTGFHKFKPQGMTGFFLLSESHLSFHTWPEENHMAVDLFTCGEEKPTRKSLKHIISGLKRNGAKKINHKIIKRGFIYTGI